VAPPRVGGGLQRAVGPAEQAGRQLLAAHPDVLEAAEVCRLSQAGRGEGVDVHHRLEQILLGAVVMPVALGRPGAHQRAPRGRRAEGHPLGQLGQAVAVVRGLAAEGDHSARVQHAPQLGHRTGQVGQMVQHRVAEDDVERVVGEGEGGGVAAGGVRVHAETAGRFAQGVEHAGGDVGGRVLGDHARQREVQPEVAGSGADLQPARIGGQAARAKDLAQLAEHLGLTALAVVDAPLRVVVLSREVVVAHIRGVNLLGGRGGGHRPPDGI